MALFVGKLPKETKDEDLEKLFSPFGSLSRCEVKANAGYGFVTFKEDKDADKAVKELSTATIHGQQFWIFENIFCDFLLRFFL